MANTKYTIVDDSSQAIGFIVINQPTFEHTSPTAFLPTEGPLSDAILFATVLTGFTLVPYAFDAPGWLSATTGILITGTLAGIKAWRGSLLEEPAADELTIKVESWTDEGRVLLDEIQDRTISLEDLRKVAKAVVVHSKNFSRPALADFISQSMYHKIKDEFVRLNFAHRKGNNYVLSPRAMAFLRKVHSLPH